MARRASHSAALAVRYRRPTSRGIPSSSMTIRCTTACSTRREIQLGCQRLPVARLGDRVGLCSPSANVCQWYAHADRGKCAAAGRLPGQQFESCRCPRGSPFGGRRPGWRKTSPVGLDSVADRLEAFGVELAVVRRPMPVSSSISTTATGTPALGFGIRAAVVAAKHGDQAPHPTGEQIDRFIGGRRHEAGMVGLGAALLVVLELPHRSDKERRLERHRYAQLEQRRRRDRVRRAPPSVRPRGGPTEPATARPPPRRRPWEPRPIPCSASRSAAAPRRIDKPSLARCTERIAAISRWSSVAPNASQVMFDSEVDRMFNKPTTSSTDDACFEDVAKTHGQSQTRECAWASVDASAGPRPAEITLAPEAPMSCLQTMFEESRCW